VNVRQRKVTYLLRTGQSGGNPNHGRGFINVSLLTLNTRPENIARVGVVSIALGRRAALVR